MILIVHHVLEAGSPFKQGVTKGDDSDVSNQKTHYKDMDVA